MARPVVLVATTDPVMACALKERLKAPCRELGLRLDICPDGDVEDEPLGARAYDSAEALFDHLDSVSRSDPMGLADTLVVLDVGANLEDAFSPAANSSDQGWHITAQRRAGVAVELILRFPQIFPVILSPAVPVDQDACKQSVATDVCNPLSLSEYRGSEEEWNGFDRLRGSFCTRHRLGGEADPIDEPLCKGDVLTAFRAPLHFVSPLDGGRGLYSTLARFARGMRCWFDPTGLRTLVKNRFLGTLFGSENDWSNTSIQRAIVLCRLNKVAVAIDEEREFAMLNAYAAYKFGRRAWMVMTFAEFDDKPLWVAQAGTQALDVIVLRDIDLRFPDLPGGDESPVREQLFSIKSKIWQQCFDGNLRLGSGKQWRIRAISSNPNVTEVANWKGEDERLGERRGQYLGLAKPIASLYETQRLLEQSNAGSYSVLSGLESVSTKGTGGRHGAPYLNLAMAESLLQQAKRCENGPVENMLGALYAGEAYELLLGMSKTTALEALLAQHKHEAAAETMFPGVSHDIDIELRRKDVETTLETLTTDKESSDGNAKSMKNMFLSQFWAELRVVYRDGEQFSAAEAANVQSLVNSRWTLVKPLWLKLKLANIATDLGSWSKAAVGLIMFSFVSYAAATDYSLEFSKDAWINAYGLARDVVLSSFALQLTGSVEDVVKNSPIIGGAVALVHMGGSYVMFGLLVAMLYRKVTRG